MLRVPGFYHLKGEPYLVRIIEASGRRYSRDEVLRAFPRTEQWPDFALSFGPIASPAIDEETFRIKTALKQIDPDPYDTWIQIGQILYDFYKGHVEGLHLWMGWAQASRKSTRRNTLISGVPLGRRTGRQLGLGTLFRLASETLYRR